MCIEQYFTKKKHKFSTFFADVIHLIDKIKLAVELEIDREYEVCSMKLKYYPQHVIQEECMKMQKKQTQTIGKITQTIWKQIKKSITNSTFESLNDSRKIVKTPSRIHYLTPKSKKSETFREAKFVPEIESFVFFERRIENSAKEYLQSSERRITHNKSRQKLEKSRRGDSFPIKRRF